MEVTSFNNSKEETINSSCEASYLSPYLPQQTYTYHLNHLQHWRFNVLNIKIVQSIFGMINWIGEITDSCSLNAARYCLENAAGERFWDWMVVIKSLWNLFWWGHWCNHNSNKNSIFYCTSSFLTFQWFRATVITYSNYWLLFFLQKFGQWNTETEISCSNLPPRPQQAQ